MDDEEEILLALADVLGSFLEFSGGPTQAVHVLKPLEKLCLVEETSVREKATEGIKKVIVSIRVKDFEVQLVDLIRRLMNGEGYTSKFSAT